MNQTKRDKEKRIVVFRISQNDKTTLSNIITKGNKIPYLKMQQRCRVGTVGDWRRQTIKVVETSNVFNLTGDKVGHEMKMYVALCPPGPNVLLLTLTPSNFNEKHTQKLKSILSCFGQDAFKNLMVIEVQNGEVQISAENQVIQDCG